jgi:hypothetical protein
MPLVTGSKKWSWVRPVQHLQRGVRYYAYCERHQIGQELVRSLGVPPRRM